jgi:hypothetical protein
MRIGFDAGGEGECGMGFRFLQNTGGIQSIPDNAPIETRADNQRLKLALMDYIWERRGKQETTAAESNGDDFN